MAKCYICKICNSYAKKLEATCQAEVNVLFLENIPQELDCLNTPE